MDGASLRQNIVVAIWECYEYFMFSGESPTFLCWPAQLWRKCFHAILLHSR